jgi:hypothetical protein
MKRSRTSRSRGRGKQRLVIDSLSNLSFLRVLRVEAVLQGEW